MAHILVIDDEESIRFSFHRFLTSEKHSVVTADCYLMALSRMDEEYFDLIIADINLHDGWGIDILQRGSREKSQNTGHHNDCIPYQRIDKN